jgi:hypothetical protein
MAMFYPRKDGKDVVLWFAGALMGSHRREKNEFPISRNRQLAKALSAHVFSKTKKEKGTCFFCYLRLLRTIAVATMTMMTAAAAMAM